MSEVDKAVRTSLDFIHHPCLSEERFGFARPVGLCIQSFDMFEQRIPI